MWLCSPFERILYSPLLWLLCCPRSITSSINLLGNVCSPTIAICLFPDSLPIHSPSLITLPPITHDILTFTRLQVDRTLHQARRHHSPMVRWVSHMKSRWGWGSPYAFSARLCLIEPFHVCRYCPYSSASDGRCIVAFPAPIGTTPEFPICVLAHRTAIP